MTDKLALKLRDVVMECRRFAEKTDDPVAARSLRGVADDVDSRLFELLLAQQCRLNGQRAAEQFFAKLIAESDQRIEHLWVAHVDESLRCLRLAAYEGTAIGISSPNKSILFDVVEYKSSGIILAHNHPSGEPSPSDSDLRSTRNLSVLLEPLDCTLIDHLIYGGGRVTSLRALGYL